VWTYADLEALPDDDLTYDILGGELVVRNVPEWTHGEVLTEMLLLLGRAAEAGYGRFYTSSTAVALDYAQRGEAARDVSHPDVFFVRQERVGSLAGRYGWEGVPDLVVEILSPSTRKEHRPSGRWWDAYERNGVPHYWLVDPRQRTIQQYTLQGEPYVSGRYGPAVVLEEGATLTSPLFPTVSMPVAQVFRYVPRPRRARRAGDGD
jgi:Uma2 family endonuclease